MGRNPIKLLSCARHLSTQIMKESSLAILLLSLGCLLSIAPVQGDDAAEEGDAEGDAAGGEEKKEDEEGGDGDKDDGKDGEEGEKGTRMVVKRVQRKKKEGCEIEEKTDYLG